MFGFDIVNSTADTKAVQAVEWRPLGLEATHDRSLQMLVEGRAIGETARAKANTIANLLPPSVRTREALRRLERAIERNSAGVRALLHHNAGDCGDAHARVTNRALLLAVLMLDGLDEAEHLKPSALEMTQIERTHCLWETITRISEDGAETRPVFVHADIAAARAYLGKACKGKSAMARLAWLGHPATRKDFVYTKSLPGQTPVLLHWKGANGTRSTTLFYCDGHRNDHELEGHIDTIDRTATLESITLIVRGRDSQEDILIEKIDNLADALIVPFNVFTSPEGAVTLVVDVRTHLILVIPDGLLENSEKLFAKPMAARRKALH